MSSFETRKLHSSNLAARKKSTVSTKLALVSAGASQAAAQTMPVRAKLVSLTRVVEVMLDWHERRRQRRQLARMDEYMLRDIGLSPADVEHETCKPFWRP